MAPDAAGPTRYARELASLVAGLGLRNGLTLDVRVELIPRAGGDATSADETAAYRSIVTGAALAVGLVDQATVDAWRAARNEGQGGVIRAWATLLRGLLPHAEIEIAVVGGAGEVAHGTLAAGSTEVAVAIG